MLWWPFGTRQRPPGGSRKPTVPCGKLKLSTFIGFWFPHATVAFWGPPKANWRLQKTDHTTLNTKTRKLNVFFFSSLTSSFSEIVILVGVWETQHITNCTTNCLTNCTLPIKISIGAPEARAARLWRAARASGGDSLIVGHAKILPGPPRGPANSRNRAWRSEQQSGLRAMPALLLAFLQARLF